MKKTIAIVMAVVLLLVGASLPQLVQAEQTYEDTVTVGVVNMESTPSDKAANLTKIENYIVEAADKGVNILVFPEVALTQVSAPFVGRRGKPDEIKAAGQALAETIPGPTTDELTGYTQKYDMYILVGMLEYPKSDPTVVYNSAVLIGPEGVVGVHRKAHLFPPEFTYATPGDEFSVFDTRYGKIGVAICADLYYFPEATRIYALEGTRLLLFPTLVFVAPGWEEMYSSFVPAHATMNGMYIASTNGVSIGGREVAGRVAFGQSMIVGPVADGGYFGNYAKIYAGPASATEEEMIIATLDLTLADEARQSILEQRRPEIYLPLVSGVIPSSVAYTIIGICGAVALIFLGLWLWERKKKVG